VALFASSTQIGLQFTPLLENGGSAVQNYILYADDGDISQENYSEVATYDGQSMTFTIDNTLETDF
jgi:hypothetical protein